MITVMFASCNGSEHLRRTLDSMTCAWSPLGGWQLISVDNGSTDDSHAVMLSYQDRLPIEVAREQIAGKNRALNRAVDLAVGNPKSDLFVFCDDDVLVPENWLVEWRAVADAQPDYSAFAGLTLPEWPFDPPEWIAKHRHLTTLYAVHGEMPEGECHMASMHGTNMSVRASIFRDGCRLNPTIGPDGSSTYAMGSETEFGLRLEKLGYKCWFAKRPVVRHIIRPTQMEPAWVLKRAYRLGRGHGTMGVAHAISPRQLSAKNLAKWILYPLLSPVLIQEAGLRRWQWAYDRGYEDGMRDRLGMARRWGRG